MYLTTLRVPLDMGLLQEDLAHALRHLEAIPILEDPQGPREPQDLQEATPPKAMDEDRHHLDEGLLQVVGDHHRQAEVVALLPGADHLRMTHMALPWAEHHLRDDEDRMTLACHDKWAT
jgi:hypothetical protein